MNNLENHPIMKLIEIDKNHIEKFVMETEEGTKRFKEKFYLKAVNDRNEFVQKEINLFEKYVDDIEKEIIERFNQLMPTDKASKFERDDKQADLLLNLVVLNTNSSNSFKLKLDYIIAKITEDTSLEEVNVILKDYIQNFHNFGITLTINDFKYSMFTEQYMETFLKNPSLEELKSTFSSIYFRCPDIITHIKMNLIYILDTYKTLLDKYVISLKEKEFVEYQVNETNTVEKYVDTRTAIDCEKATDPYNNAILFLEGGKKIDEYLEGSQTRTKIYDMFVHNNTYEALDEQGKDNYLSAVTDLYFTLNELKNYYKYEFLLNDLLKRYKNKDSVKGQYTSKKKEIEKAEKKRLSIYKDYLKANGIGFLSKKSDEKIKEARLNMNEQIRTLSKLYEELHDLEITNMLNQLTSSASIYDLFTCALTSFSFLENSFKKEETFQETSLEENIHDYLTFIYNPNNNILRKINVFAEYNIVEVIAEKYKLLDLEITSEMINKDNIDSTLESLKVIQLIQNIEISSISLHDIEILCSMKNIIKEREEKEKEISKD